MADSDGAAPLFAIFFLAIYSLVLVPLTLYRLCNPAEEATKPWEAVRLATMPARIERSSECGRAALGRGAGCVHYAC